MRVRRQHVELFIYRRRTHRGNGSFAPVLLKVPGQTSFFPGTFWSIISILFITPAASLGMAHHTVKAASLSVTRCVNGILMALNVAMHERGRGWCVSQDQDQPSIRPVKVGLDLEQIAVEGFLALTCLLGPSDEHIKSLQLLDTGKVVNLHKFKMAAIQSFNLQITVVFPHFLRATYTNDTPNESS